MPQRIQGKPIMIRCAFEKWVRNCSFFQLVHDGSTGLGDKRRYFFTRYYALKVDGKLTNMGMKFTYDYRINTCDFTIDDIPLAIMDSAKSATDVTEEMIGDIIQERADQKVNGAKHA